MARNDLKQGPGPKNPGGHSQVGSAVLTGASRQKVPGGMPMPDSKILSTGRQARDDEAGETPWGQT